MCLWCVFARWVASVKVKVSVKYNREASSECVWREREKKSAVMGVNKSWGQLWPWTNGDEDGLLCVLRHSRQKRGPSGQSERGKWSPFGVKMTEKEEYMGETWERRKGPNRCETSQAKKVKKRDRAFAQNSYDALGKRERERERDARRILSLKWSVVFQLVSAKYGWT